MNFRSIRDLKILITMLLVIATYFVFRGALACYAGESESPFVLWQHLRLARPNTASHSRTLHAS